ncbi:DinB superfamily protein [Planctomycetes bacterium Pan216]|uniref:DinB superfamily protein n=1 Tax=Kolteria novifilia TaxID=2527975 RepID=A0A518B7S3_9BACT|nr:DinB superfamily protein [Planctomycetes bacterium Pan216]
MQPLPTAAAPWLTSALGEFVHQKDLAERALAQVDEQKLHQPLDEHTNSLAVIVQHIAGNLASRWTDPLTTDGEKPNRRRDDEFVDQSWERSELTRRWNGAFELVVATLSSLSIDDLDRSVVIRGEKLTLEHAVLRSLAHTSFHIGQIVLLARVLTGEEWNVLTIPRGPGESEIHNRTHWGEATPEADG